MQRQDQTPIDFRVASTGVLPGNYGEPVSYAKSFSRYYPDFSLNYKGSDFQLEQGKQAPTKSIDHFIVRGMGWEGGPPAETLELEIVSEEGKAQQTRFMLDGQGYILSTAVDAEGKPDTDHFTVIKEPAP